ncbi:MAG: peptidoglycan DD-metalloendopeptidase family protein [Betaproteobacteria bacterium]|nr:peptidoglycan DD-metalloendopeptidase family protein [Betaproteobacteria bacterium]
MTTTRPKHLPILRARRAIALVAIAALVAGCATRTPAPVVERAPQPPARTAPAAASVAAPPAPATAAKAPAEPDWRPQTYTVKRGDTLYQVALEHGLDYRDLAAWNGIENVNVIRVGQSLRLTAPGSEAAPAAVASATGAPGTTTAPLRTAPPVGAGDARPALPASSPTAAPTGTPRPVDGASKTTPRAVKEPWSEQAMRDVARSGGGVDAPGVASAEPATRSAPPPMPAGPSVAQAPAPVAPPPVAAPAAGPSPGDDEGLDWVWPAKGKLVAAFSESATLKGIDIAGAGGDPVLASAPGKVVYAGAGLRGYGKLVIVKHNATYLTAYAHNREILVKEGQSVTRGQKIAEMGSTDADRVKLHFEIRRLGKPMDPLRYLPPA